MNHITIELCAEDRARLDKIIEKLDSVSRPLYAIDLADVHDGAEVEPQEPKTAELTNNPPKPKEATQAKTENESATPAVTVDDIRSKYMGLATTPKREEARMLIKLYADKISDIPEDKRAEVLEKLNALEG